MYFNSVINTFNRCFCEVQRKISIIVDFHHQFESDMQRLFIDANRIATVLDYYTVMVKKKEL